MNTNMAFAVGRFWTVLSAHCYAPILDTFHGEHTLCTEIKSQKYVVFCTEACDLEHTFEPLDSSQHMDWLILYVTHFKTLKGHDIVTWKKRKICKNILGVLQVKGQTLISCKWHERSSSDASEREERLHSLPANTAGFPPPTSCYVKVPVTSAFLHTADKHHIIGSHNATQHSEPWKPCHVGRAHRVPQLGRDAGDGSRAWQRSDSNSSRANTVKDNRREGGVWYFYSSMQMCSFIQCSLWGKLSLKKFLTSAKCD